MTRRSAVWITLLLLVIAASRIPRMAEMPMNEDEVWSVWQTFGTPAQILQWTPYDWPPLYYLSLGAWRMVAGAWPVVLRAFSALLFMLGSVFFYQSLKRLRGIDAAFVGTLAYAGLGFSLQLSLEVRGYALELALLPLALYLLLRYFDSPGWRLAVLLGLSLAAMFYTSFTSVGAIAMLGLFALILYRARALHGWRPALIFALLALPEIIRIAGLSVSRVAATQTLDAGPLLPALGRLYWFYAGFPFAVWALLFVLATGLVLNHERRLSRFSAALLSWTLLMPLLLYALNPLLGFFSPRYAWWILPGLALWIGAGLAYVPRLRLSIVPLLVGLCFVTLPTSGQYQIFQNLSPLNENFAWLREEIQGGDVILDDPFSQCGKYREWDYYLRLYFPNGLRFVTAPSGEHRLWVLNAGEQPDSTQAALAQDYVPGRFVGPPGCTFRLYEAPPNRDGILFENGMRFHGAEFMESRNPVVWPLYRREFETVRLRLWWSVDEAVPLDYSVNTYLAWADAAAPGVDGPPQPTYPLDAPSQTSQWQPGQFYVEERELTLDAFSGTYFVQMAVYFWEDGLPFAAPGVDENGHLRIQQVIVKAF